MRSPTLHAAIGAVRLAWRAARAVLVCQSIVLLVQAAVPVAGATALKSIIDMLVRPGARFADALPTVVMFAACGLLGALLPHVNRYLQHEIDRAVGLAAQNQLYTAVERFDGLGRFEDPEFQDRLRLAQQSAGTTSGQLIGDLTTVAASGVTIAGFLGVLFVINDFMVLCVVAGVIPVAIAEVAMARRRVRLMWGLSPVERREFFYSHLLSTVEAAKEVRLFGIGPFLRGRMVAERRSANLTRRGQDRRELRMQAMLGSLSASIVVGGLLWAASSAFRGDLSVGELSVFVAGLAGVQSSLVGSVSTAARTNQQLLMFRNFQEVIAAGPDLARPAEPRQCPPLRHGIELRDVWFRYSEDHPWILRGVDLYIPCGTVVALVGRNGAGKSTLIKLLCRLYDPTRGSIRWDGIDLRELDIALLRERIGAVFQDFMQYDMTVAENVAVGDIGSLDQRDRIEEAARTAGVHDVLAALPRGYDTMLTRMFGTPGEEDDPSTGVVLSTGQGQRLALARAMLRSGRDLMILDEPSAGLDAVAEHEVHLTVRRQRHGATSILISHRMGAVRDADVIAVLSDGQITELGDHDLLMANDGLYAELFRTQARGYAQEVNQT